MPGRRLNPWPLYHKSDGIANLVRNMGQISYWRCMQCSNKPDPQSHTWLAWFPRDPPTMTLTWFRCWFNMATAGHGMSDPSALNALWNGMFTLLGTAPRLYLTMAVKCQWNNEHKKNQQTDSFGWHSVLLNKFMLHITYYYVRGF